MNLQDRITEAVNTALAKGMSLADIARAAEEIAAMKGERERLQALLEFQKIVVPTLSQLASADQDRMALVRQKDDLEKEIVRLKDWSNERTRYRMAQAWSGAIVYALAQSEKGSEPPHWLCANCFNRFEKSFLTTRKKAATRDAAELHSLACTKCNASSDYPYNGTLPKPAYAPD